jgi:pimeloyl-ACP methyl ester carboxylesterase
MASPRTPRQHSSGTTISMTGTPPGAKPEAAQEGDGSATVRIPTPQGTCDVEYRRVASGPADAPQLVFLHESLGSCATWRDFPDRLCAAGGFRGLAYSRPGFGRTQSRLARRRWPLDYMHTEGLETLPALLQALGEPGPCWLFGHSDGGSIALIAATVRARYAGVIALAPHVFVEETTLRGVAAMGAAAADGRLLQRLARHHDDPEGVFHRWHDTWLDPAFRDWNIEPLLAGITCPVLAIQGTDDEYGTMEQVERLGRAVPRCMVRELARCGHAPHRDHPDAVIDATVAFIRAHGAAPGESTP